VLLDACSGRPGGRSAAPTTAPPTTIRPVPTSAAGGPARTVVAGPRGGDRVALTFHGSGDPTLAVRLLELLEQSRAPVSLFAVGAWLETYPGVARRFLAGRHELDNHTATHPVLSQVPQPVVAEEIRACRRILTRLTGSGGRYFRPSGMRVPTPLVLAEARKAGYPVVVSFDVDSHDYDDPGPDAIVGRVTAGLRPGSIVSLHTGHAGTVSALPRVLAMLDARGLRPVRLHDLLMGR
jgi:peptidoglycan/xylan/chitin deacetylase (PgdA/CDA1 family)